MIIVVRTDSQDAYCGLYNDRKLLSERQWTPGRELSQQLLSTITTLLENRQVQLNQIEGVIVYKGPGSYTGLRIEASIANALGYSFAIPVVATSGEDWVEMGLNKLNSKSEFKPISPEYGGNARVTSPKK